MNPPDMYGGQNNGGWNSGRRNSQQRSQMYPDVPQQPDYGYAGGQQNDFQWDSSTSGNTNNQYNSPQSMYPNPAPGQGGGYNPYERMSYPPNQEGGNNANYFGDPQQNSQQNFGMGGNMFGGAFSQQLMSDPAVMNAAKAYGEQFAEQQKAKFSQYVSWAHLRYYFAVDNAYVGKKLGLLLFPFAHSDWSVRYSNDEEPVPPRLDVNAPDLYIPCMAIVTYVLVAGYLMGTQGRFSPEQLGRMTSNAVAWLIVENLVILLTKYIMNISQSLSFFHSVAYSSYKFVGMIVSLIAFMIGGSSAYYGTLLYSAGAVAFFLVRTVKGFVLDSNPTGYADGTKRKLYLLLFISLTQPFIMWWLTSSLTSFKATLGQGFDGFEDWTPGPMKAGPPIGGGGPMGGGPLGGGPMGTGPPIEAGP